MFVYLGAPIDRSSSSPLSHFQSLADALTAENPLAVMFTPFSAFLNARPDQTQPHDAVKIKNINDHAIRQSDLCLFKVTQDSSFGLPVEVYMCRNMGKPFIVWHASGDKPAPLYLTAAVYMAAELGVFARLVHNAEELSQAIQSYMKWNGHRALIGAEHKECPVDCPEA